MRYNRFGSTGLVVSELCLGAMTFGVRSGGFIEHNLDQADSTAMVRQALDAGINFIDTADIYTGGEREQLGRGGPRGPGVPGGQGVDGAQGMGQVGDGVNDAGSNRYHLMHQIDGSLARLGLDHVDLYQIHGWDPHCGLEEQLRALEDIVRSGRARYVGISNWAAWQIAKALGIEERRGWDGLASVQAFYAVCSRELERELVPMMESEGLGLMVWSPLAGGLLTGKYSRGADGGTVGEGRRSKFAFPQVDEEAAHACVDAMRPMAERRGVPVLATALAGALHPAGVSSVIVGVSRPDQLEQNLQASGVELTSEELTVLDGVAPPGPEYPGWMIDGQVGRNAYRITPRRAKR